MHEILQKKKKKEDERELGRNRGSMAGMAPHKLECYQHSWHHCPVDPRNTRRQITRATRLTRRGGGDVRALRRAGEEWWRGRLEWGSFTHVANAEESTSLPPKKKKASYIEDDGQRRREGAALAQRGGNVQGHHFDAHGCPVAAGRGWEDARPAGGHDDAVAFSEGHQQQVVQAS